MTKAEVAFLQQFRIMRQRTTDLLNADPTCLGKITGTTLDMLGELAALGALSPLQALALGRVQERQDVLTFLEGRQRAAATIAAKSPENGDSSDTHFKAKWSAEQIGVEIESILQGLHEYAGCVRLTQSNTSGPQDGGVAPTVEAPEAGGPEAAAAASAGSAAVAGYPEIHA
jgi:hypothetical protein